MDKFWRNVLPPAVQGGPLPWVRQSLLVRRPVTSPTPDAPVRRHAEAKSLGFALRRAVSPLYSTSARLALGYAALFAASSLLLVGSLWWHTAGYIDRQINGAIAADARQISDQLRDFGLPGAIEAINERVAEAPDSGAIYLLADWQLKPLAGNLRTWPAEAAQKPGSYEIELVRDGQLRATRLRTLALPGDLHLLVGRDVENRAELRALIIDGLCWAAATAFLLGIVGAILVRHAVLSRVGMINDTASAIINGDLSQRLPARDTTDAFDRLAETINAMLQQIQQLIERVRNTSNAIAHDLRTPLAELRARLEELLLTRPERETAFEEIHKAVADLDRVIAVFNALLRLAEIDSGVRRSGFRRVELADLATDVAELYAPLTEEKGVIFTVDARSGLAVNGDPHLLAQAVGNLVDNAVKYAPSHGEVSMRIARSEKGCIEISVSDDGPGIPDTEKTRVTTRFYRGHSSAGTSGIGLGLSVVEAVARLHDGDLTLSDNHPGLTASLRLPAATEPAPRHPAMA
jgi:signal transduction histidine kinase